MGVECLFSWGDHVEMIISGSVDDKALRKALSEE